MPEILRFLRTEQLTHLWIGDDPELHDLALLRAFPALTSLTLQNCPAVESLAPLADVPLTSLSITGNSGGALPTPPGLDTLGQLEFLSLYTSLTAEDFTAFPADAPLQRLALGQPVGADFTLDCWPGLSRVQLRSLAGGFGERQWHALSRLTNLESFSFGLAEGEPALKIPPGLGLPQVKSLGLLNTGHRSSAEFSGIMRTALPVFPRIEELQLYGMVRRHLDLSPAAGLASLRKVFLSNLTPAPTYSLPPHVNLTLFPRPRT
ncbi:hypothetical protein ACFU90_32465 [Streptomyces noursei]|uniref:hypothetical protein n=1 Tax=Streptomyces noursei TaxID=1971 RepID=UPI0035DDB7D3